MFAPESVFESLFAFVVAFIARQLVGCVRSLALVSSHSANPEPAKRGPVGADKKFNLCTGLIARDLFSIALGHRQQVFPSWFRFSSLGAQKLVSFN